MNLRDIALRIPATVRRLRILTSDDPISNAKPSPSDAHMQLLFAVWFDFVEPSRKGESDLHCGSCLRHVLNNFRELRDTLIELEKESQIYELLH